MRKGKKIENTISVLVFLCSCIFIFGCFTPKVVKKTTVATVQKREYENIESKVTLWPDHIEITAQVFDEKDKTSYRVHYKYMKNDNTAVLSLNPLNTKNKQPSEIHLDKSGKVLKVDIWGVGDYDCSFDYAEMSGSLCQAAEDKYTYFCAPGRMNCEAVVKEILLKELWEWL